MKYVVCRFHDKLKSIAIYLGPLALILYEAGMLVVDFV